MKLKSTFTLLALMAIVTIKAAPLIVSSSMSLSGQVLQYDYIWVQAGTTLNLTGCYIEINQNDNIIISAGGKLVLDNTTLTVKPSNVFPNYWQGVKVLGNPNATQTSANQGKLVLKNNSIIEKALVGISVGELKYSYYINNNKNSNWHQSGGGIVHSINSTIKNCRWGVIFSPYYNGNLQRPYANYSNFTNTTFMWDNDANERLCFTLDKEFKTLVQLNFVHDVRFIGCTFSNDKLYKDWFRDSTYTIDSVNFRSDFLSRGTGLYSYGSSFYLRPQSPCTALPGEGSCYTCTGQKTTFKYLSRAINLQSHKRNVYNFPNLPIATLTTHMEISNCYFYNNYNSICSNITELDFGRGGEISDQDIATYYLIGGLFINRNKFYVDENYYKYNYVNHARDISLDECGEVEISDNEFEHKIAGNFTGRPKYHLNYCEGADMAYIRINQTAFWDINIHRNVFKDNDAYTESCGRTLYFLWLSGQVGGVKITCNEFKADRFFQAPFNGVWGEPHTDMIINNSLYAIPNFGTPTTATGNIWSKRPQYYYWDINHLEIYAKDTLSASNFTYFHKRTDRPLYIKNRFGDERESLPTWKKYLDSTLVTQQNICAVSSHCSFYQGYDTDPNNMPWEQLTENIANPYVPFYKLSVSPNPGTEGNIHVILEPENDLGVLGGVIEIKDKNGILYDTRIVPIGVSFFDYYYSITLLPPGIYYITYIDTATGRRITKMFIKL